MSLRNILISALLFCSSAIGQSSPFVPANDVIFRITTPNVTYKIGDTIEIHYTIRNISSAPILVPRDEFDVKCLGPRHLTAWFEVQTATGVVGSCLGSDYVSLTDKISKGMILVKPGKTVRGSFRFETRKLSNQLKPGQCRLQVMLSGWRRDYFIAEEQEKLSRAHRRILTGDAVASTTVSLTR